MQMIVTKILLDVYLFLAYIGTDTFLGSNKCPQRLTFGIDVIGFGPVSSTHGSYGTYHTWITGFVGSRCLMECTQADMMVSRGHMVDL
jgi:hypothetical protein